MNSLATSTASSAQSPSGLVIVPYLRDVLTRLPNMTNRQIPEVTPEAWAKAQRASAATAAKTS